MQPEENSPGLPVFVEKRQPNVGKRVHEAGERVESGSVFGSGYFNEQKVGDNGSEWANKPK